MSATADDGLLGPTDVRRQVAALGLRPTKSLGQNFVVDPNTVRRIVRTAALGPDDVVIEVGITADSFVVFFERLRDEIREGRRLRSGVERAWPRARRTILSADTVSLLAAVVLYLVSIGDVRGFAFTLGLSTLSDLFIVFFFTKPLLTLLARRPAFDSGKPWTGVGKARAGVVRDVDIEDAPQRGSRISRPKPTEA